jgi:membrane fusion protein (multidrug efflux system)
MRFNYLLLVLAFFLQSCHDKPEPMQDDVFKVVHPVIKNTTYTTEYVAEIQSVRFVEVRSKIKSYIEDIHVDEGQAVKEGQPLFTLNHMEFDKQLQKADAAYKSAVADLKVAEVELRNVSFLANKNIVSSSELAVTRAKADALKAEVDEAKAHKELVALNIAFAKIKAPFSGTINRIPKKVGSLINEGDMLTSISDNREVFAYFNLSEIDYLKRFSGEKPDIKFVSLKLADNTLYAHEGVIETIESEFDKATGNIAFRARFPNPDKILRHGSNAKVIIEEPLRDVIFVPQKSTFEVQDQIYVYKVDKDGVLKQHNIVPKMRIQYFYIVASGLSKDDVIVYEGVENLKDGQKIQTEPATISEITPVTTQE